MIEVTRDNLCVVVGTPPMVADGVISLRATGGV